MSQVLPSLLLSLRIAVLATLLAAIVAVPLAWWLARHRLVGQSLVEALLCVPLVLPPTVVGYFLILLLGKQGWLTGWIGSGYSILFRVEGAVLAAAVVALPMLYIPAKAAFAGVERELEDVAVLMGAGRLRVFWNVSVPIARRGLLSGLILAFARSLGEFGATLMVYGNQVRYAADQRLTDRLTLPILVYNDFEAGEMHAAWIAVVTLSLLSLGLILAYNRSSAARQD